MKIPAMIVDPTKVDASSNSAVLEWAGRETLKTSTLTKCKLLLIVVYLNMDSVKNIVSNNKEICVQVCVCACSFSKQGIYT